MSKVAPSPPSHRCNTDRTTSETPLSQQRNTGSSYKKSYPIISPYRSLSVSGASKEITSEVEVHTSVSRARARGIARFLKGPIPLQDIARAACLPGKALAVYLAIHHRCDLKGHSAISLPAGLLRQFGVNRNAKARALQQLEQAGLVQVERKGRSAARISLVMANTA